MDISIGDIIRCTTFGGGVRTMRVLHIDPNFGKPQLSGELVDPRSFTRMRGGPFARTWCYEHQVTATLYRVAR
jgi:hypothetical protein